MKPTVILSYCSSPSLVLRQTFEDYAKVLLEVLQEDDNTNYCRLHSRPVT